MNDNDLIEEEISRALSGDREAAKEIILRLVHSLYSHQKPDWRVADYMANCLQAILDGAEPKEALNINRRDGERGKEAQNLLPPTDEEVADRLAIEYEASKAYPTRRNQFKLDDRTFEKVAAEFNKARSEDRRELSADQVKKAWKKFGASSRAAFNRWVTKNPDLFKDPKSWALGPKKDTD